MEKIDKATLLLEDYPYLIDDVNINEEALRRIGNEQILNGGLKILRLVGEDSEVHLRPKVLLSPLNGEEIAEFESEMFSALYELGDFSGSGIASGGSKPWRPFSLTHTAPRILFGLSGTKVGKKPSPVPSNPTNIIAVHEQMFQRDDRETAALLSYIKFRNNDEPTGLSFILELPGTPLEDIPRIQARLEQMNVIAGHKMRVRPLDLATALQSAVQRGPSSMEHHRQVKLFTSAKGPNGGNIVISSKPKTFIILREYPSSEENSRDPAITSVVIERPIC